MKYHAIWKPGGHPRRGMGSMKASKRKIQAIKPKGAIPGEGVDSNGSKAA